MFTGKRKECSNCCIVNSRYLIPIKRKDQKATLASPNVQL
jgi:hypothetical protein